MNETNSFSQIAFIILFQIALRLIGLSIDFYPKILLFLTVDFSMLSIFVSEWFRVEVDWQLWILKVFGEPKK